MNGEPCKGCKGTSACELEAGTNTESVVLVRRRVRQAAPSNIGKVSLRGFLATATPQSKQLRRRRAIYLQAVPEEDGQGGLSPARATPNAKVFLSTSSGESLDDREDFGNETRPTRQHHADREGNVAI